MGFATLSHGLVTLSSTYCFPLWFLPLCATRALSYLFIFELSGFPLSIVYSLVVFATLCCQGFVMLLYSFFNWWFSTFNCLVVFATLCRQGFVMLLYLFLNWWFSTFNCLFPGDFCHSVPPGLCHVTLFIFELVVFHFQLFIPWWFLPLCATRVVILRSFSYWWSSTFPIFCLFPGGFYHSEPPGLGPIFINDTSWTVSVGRIEVQSCLFGEFGVFERCRTDSSF